MMTVRTASFDDLPRLMEVYREAREIMLSCGNLHQWAPGHPSEEIVRNDIAGCQCHVIENDGKIIGVFVLISGEDPTYSVIDGKWTDNVQPYMTIHRLASTKESKGVAKTCFDWCWEQSHNLRVDTHEDNVIMRHCILKAGFDYCGIIHLQNGDPRFAFQKTGIPLTEGIKYTGSKLKLLPYILDAVKSIDVKSVLDGFSGTTRVSQALSRAGYDVTSNDLSEWSEVFGNCYLVSEKPDSFYQDIINQLNVLPGYDGWFTEKYGGRDESGKMPFQIHNTRKLDAIRDAIDTMGLEWVDKCVILTSLILAMDTVDNTLGHYASYLSGWSPRSYKTMEMRLPKRVPSYTRNTVLKGDVFEAAKIHHDLAYYDPPYGSNNEKMPPSRVRYSSYYHIWKTIILNDKPEVFGKSNRREDTHDTESSSVFEEYRKDNDGKFIAMKAIERLIKETDAEYILLSYSSGGRATREELYDIINTNGHLLSSQEIDYRKNVMALFSWTSEWLNDSGEHKEYLFLMKKDS